MPRTFPRSAVAALVCVLTLVLLLAATRLHAASAASRVPSVRGIDHVRGSRRAPVTLIEYADFQCPFCQKHHPVMQKLVNKYRGNVNWVYRHYPLAFHEHARPAAIAAECAGRLGGEAAFWKYADALFAADDLGAVSFERLAHTQGLETDSFRTCLRKQLPKTRIENDLSGGTKAGVSGTPATFVVHRQSKQMEVISGAQPIETFEEAIDRLLRGSNLNVRRLPRNVKPQIKPLPSNPPPALEESESGAAKLPAVSSADHVRGPAAARFTLVEYGDYQCPFCQRHHATMQQLLKNHPNDLNWVFRHFPLSFHEAAMPAAIAAECAGKLRGHGAFWAYTDELYEQPDITQTQFVELAVQRGISRRSFNECIADPAIEKAITRSVTAGEKAGVSGTPANFLIDHRDGEIREMHGAQPLEAFEKALKEMRQTPAVPEPPQEGITPQ